MNINEGFFCFYFLLATDKISRATDSPKQNIHLHFFALFEFQLLVPPVKETNMTFKGGKYEDGRKCYTSKHVP